MNTELYHHGVLGMKWGVRRYQPYGEGGYNPKTSKNPNYSDSQRASDRSLYGKRSEKRINRRMNEGENIVAARHHEVVRRDKINNAKRITKKAVKLTGTAAAFAGSIYYYKNKDKVDAAIVNGINKTMKNASNVAQAAKGKALFKRLGL